MKIGDSPEVLIDRAELIFWDFDGVIKDSVSAKTSAFEKLFLPYGQKIVQKVKQHHEANGGVSRFEKMPLYLSWAGEDVSDELVDKFCNLFSEAVLQSVIESPWVPGVYEYLTSHHREKYFVLVTATPQGEIEKILFALEIDHFFRQIFGAPTKKEDAIRLVLEKQKGVPDDALMIGDAEADLQAAEANSILFLLRRTPQNLHLQNCYDGPQFDELSYE
jgi:phosphoglycolate phosphatase-like HAD superfamily hydrolase